MDKKCCKCKLLLNKIHFHKNKSEFDGLQNYCINCFKFYQNIKKTNKFATRKWRNNNLEKAKECTNNWRRNNPDKHAAKEAKRRSAKLQRTPKWLTNNDWEKIKEFYYYARLMTETLDILHEVDHIIPLQGENISGLHVPENLQILTEFDNCSKGNKF